MQFSGNESGIIFSIGYTAYRQFRSQTYHTYLSIAHGNPYSGHCKSPDSGYLDINHPSNDWLMFSNISCSKFSSFDLLFR